VRNLLLAGADIHERTPQKWTALHICSERGDAGIMSVLLDNGADVMALDSDHNNALHIAAKHGNYDVCKVLLVESSINAEMGNIKGQNPIHLLARLDRSY
jgi:ankyrin repeat protein